MQNNDISLAAFEVIITTLQRETTPSLHDQLMLCRIALTLIADVRELNAALAVANESRVREAAQG